MANSTLSLMPREAYLRLADGTRWPVVGGVSVGSETEFIRSLMSTVPDTDWSHTDSHGHLHKYIRDEEGVPRLPSLERRSRHIACEGSCGDYACDGYSVSEWFCRECGDQEEPGFKPDYEAENPGIPVSRTTTYTLTVEMPTEPTRDPIIDAVFVHVDPDGVEQEFSLPFLVGHSWQVENRGAGGVFCIVGLSGTRQDAVTRKPTGP